MRRGIQKLWLCVFLLLDFAIAQNVGIGTTSPHPSAKLDIKANNQGLLIPRLTTAQRNAISNPAHSLLIFNIDNFCIEVYDSVSGQWLAVSCPSVCSPCDTCPLPVVDSIVGAREPCIGDTVLFVIHGQGGRTYVWTTPIDWVHLGGRDTSKFIFGGQGWLYASLCNECGCVADSVYVSEGTAPASMVISGVDSVCLGDTFVLRALATNATYYQWFFPSSLQVIGGVNLDSIVFVSTDTGHVQVIATACNNCGCSPEDTFEIYVEATFVNSDLVGPQYICLPDTVTYYVNNYVGGNLQWQYPATWQLIAQDSNYIVLYPDSSDGYIYVEFCSSGGCVCIVDSLYVVADTCRSFCMTIGTTSGYETVYGITPVDEGGYLLVGNTTSYGGTTNIYAIRLDEAGNILWEKVISASLSDNVDVAMDVIQTNDGGFAIVGYTNSFGLSNYDVVVMKLDKTGNLEWSVRIGGNNDDYGRSIVQSSDKGYIVTGVTYSYGSGGGDLYVIKLDSLGNLMWTKTIGGADYDVGLEIKATHRGTYVIVGDTRSFGAGANDVYVVEIDNNGNILKNLVIGGIADDYGRTIVTTPDNGLVVGGATYSYGAGRSDILIFKLDSNSNVLWAKVLGGAGFDAIWDVMVMENGDIAAGGYNSSFTIGYYDGSVLRMDQQGNIKWVFTKSVGTGGDEEIYAATLTPDGSVIIAGNTAASFSVQRDIYVARLDANWEICPGNCGIVSGGNVIDVILNLTNGGNVSSGGSSVAASFSTNPGISFVDLCF